MVSAGRRLWLTAFHTLFSRKAKGCVARPINARGAERRSRGYTPVLSIEGGGRRVWNGVPSPPCGRGTGWGANLRQRGSM